MTPDTSPPGIAQPGETLDALMGRFLRRNYQAGERAMIAAALLVALVPQRVLSRPDPRPATLVPRWAIDLLRSEVDELSPGLVEELKEILRKAGQKV